ncbi:MAG: glycosyltransferase [Anaeromyxobacter sp.]
MSTVSVIVPTRDGRRFLERCLPALEGSRLPPGWALEVLLVDNGSRDGTAAWAARFPRVRVLAFDRPLGFAAANNAARGAARGEVIAFLNNDTAPEPEWLVRPLALLAGDPGVAAVGAKLLFMHRFVPVTIRATDGAPVLVGEAVHGGPLDGKVRWPAGAARRRAGGALLRELPPGAAVHLPIPLPGLDAPARRPVLRLAGRGGPVALEVPGRAPLRLGERPGIAPLELEGAVTMDLIQNAGTALTAHGEGSDAGAGEPDGPRWSREEVVPALCGAALLARRTALDRAGWFPPYYTMYYEDTDLSLRLRRLGLLVFCPGSRVRHYHTGTSREGSPAFVEHVARSTLLFAARHGAPALAVRTFARRARDVVHECRAAAPGGLDAVWRAPGTRGSLRALSALPAVLVDRLRGEGGGPLDLPRRPYAGSAAAAAAARAAG